MFYIYAFYIDVFIEQNFLMNLLVLSMTSELSKSAVRHKYLRMVISSGIGALLAAILLLLRAYWLSVFLTAVIVVPLMLFLAFGRCSKKQFVLRILISWFGILLLNGIVTAFSNFTGIRGMTWYVAAVTIVIGHALVKVWLCNVRQQRNLYEVKLKNDGKEVCCVGLYDSGNRLQMPVSGEPVHIVSMKIFEQLKKKESRITEIPFQALGTTEGRISATEIESMELLHNQAGSTYKNVWVGCADAALLQGKSYQVILHSSIHNESL